MKLSEDELALAGADAHAVIDLAKAAGVFVFGGGISESVDPVLVAADGAVTPDIDPGADMTGGFAVFKLPTRQDAVEWAGKIAVACRRSQELREFMSDPAS